MIYSLDQYFKQAKCIYTRRKIQVSENTSFIHLFSSSIEEKNNTEMNLMKMYSYGDKCIFIRIRPKTMRDFGLDWVFRSLKLPARPPVLVLQMSHFFAGDVAN